MNYLMTASTIQDIPPYIWIAFLDEVKDSSVEEISNYTSINDLISLICENLTQCTEDKQNNREIWSLEFGNNYCFKYYAFPDGIIPNEHIEIWIKKLPSDEEYYLRVWFLKERCKSLNHLFPDSVIIDSADKLFKQILKQPTELSNIYNKYRIAMKKMTEDYINKIGKVI